MYESDRDEEVAATYVIAMTTRGQVAIVTSNDVCGHVE